MKERERLGTYLAHCKTKKAEERLSLINQLIVRCTDVPSPSLYTWEEKQIAIEALKLLREGK